MKDTSEEHRMLAASSESIDDEAFPKVPSKTLERRPLGSSTWMFLTRVLAALGLILLGIMIRQSLNRVKPRVDVYRPWTLPKNLNQCDCGPDIKTALTRNCVYDSLATAWLPPHCRDDELTTEFERSGPGPNGEWPYFADANGSIPINTTYIAQLGESNGTFWSLRDWHIAHCVFYWKKTMRMRETGVVLEERFDQIMHVQHCGRLIMKPRPEGIVLLEVDVRMNSAKS